MIENVFIQIAIKTGVQAATKSLIDKFSNQSIIRTNTDKNELISAINLHMESTFDKCVAIKTILKDKKEEFQKIYSDQGFLLNEKRCDQNELIKFIRKDNSTILLGTGGGGKSMFTRYLWLSYFADSQDRIPIFIELRNLNNSKYDKLTDFIFHTIIDDSSKVSQSVFEKSLAAGEFILFLDGFDEVSHARRDEVEKSIIQLKEKHKKLTLFLTSRHDERFLGWHQFETVKVAPLEKNEVLDLIDRAPFPRQERTKMMKKISSGLFESHHSFLTNPLLAYMMLVTYSYNPDFSDRMYIFYEQAFEALYHRHDLTKSGGYKREFYTKLEKEKFERILSYFCLRTYYDEKFEFSAHELNLFIDDAKSIESTEFGGMNNQDFIKDMVENVCLLKKEGMEFNFTHRSFQEYFSAFCVARVASRNLEGLFQQFSYRFNDEVLNMVYDMNVDLFREKYIAPIHKKHSKFFKLIKKTNISCKYSILTNTIFTISLKRKNSLGITLTNSGSLQDFSRNIRRISSYVDDTNSEPIARRDSDLAIQKLLSKIYGKKYDRIKLEYSPKHPILFGVKENSSELIEEHLDELAEIWSECGMKHFVEKNAFRIHDFVKSEMGAYKMISTKFDELFG